MLKADLSRNGTITRHLLFLSVTGSSVRDRNMLSKLAGVLGTSKASITTGSHRRTKLDNDQELVPIVSRLHRKSPGGQNVISDEWMIQAYSFFETENVSDVVKGTNNVYKVCL